MYLYSFHKVRKYEEFEETMRLELNIIKLKGKIFIIIKNDLKIWGKHRRKELQIKFSF